MVVAAVLEGKSYYSGNLYIPDDLESIKII